MKTFRLFVGLTAFVFLGQHSPVGTQKTKISMIESIPVITEYLQKSGIVDRGYYWTALELNYAGDSAYYEAWLAKPDTSRGIYFRIGVTTVGEISVLPVPDTLRRVPRLLPAPQLPLQRAASLASDYIIENRLNSDSLYLNTINLILPGPHVKEPYWYLELRKWQVWSPGAQTLVIAIGDDIKIAVTMDGTVWRMGSM